MIPIFRMTGSTLGAFCITMLFCMIAPMMSDKLPDHPEQMIDPVRIVSVSAPVQKPKKKIIVPQKELRFSNRPQKTLMQNEKMEPMKIRMSPLKLEMAPAMAAVLPAPVAPEPVQPEARTKAAVTEAPAVLGVAAVDTPPRLKRYTRPLYPSRAKGQRVEGKVFVRCVVSAGGNVKEAKIIRADPAGYFESSALKSVKKWTFVPARLEGKKVAVFVDIPLSFSLDK